MANVIGYEIQFRNHLHLAPRDYVHTPHQDSKGGARGAAGAGARGNPHHPLRKGGPVYLGFLQYGTL